MCRSSVKNSTCVSPSGTNEGFTYQPGNPSKAGYLCGGDACTIGGKVGGGKNAQEALDSIESCLWRGLERWRELGFASLSHRAGQVLPTYACLICGWGKRLGFAAAKCVPTQPTCEKNGGLRGGESLPHHIPLLRCVRDGKGSKPDVLWNWREAEYLLTQE